MKIDLKDLVRNVGLKKARQTVRDNYNAYFAQVKKLIGNKENDGLKFARIFLEDERIHTAVQQILQDENLDFSLRIQALYEILTENKTPERIKEEWLSYLVTHLDQFRELCLYMYQIDDLQKREKYLEMLINQKITNTADNKKWLYYVELIAMSQNKKRTKQILESYLEMESDLFVKKAAQKCLDSHGSSI